MSTSFSSLLNYELADEYSPEKPHQAVRIGERYYGCDTNGNLIEESSAPIGQSEAGEAPREQRISDVRRVDQGWGYEFDTEEKENVYRRFFKWDSENRLTSVSEGADVTSFLYRCRWRADQQTRGAGRKALLQRMVDGKQRRTAGAAEERCEYHRRGRPLTGIRNRSSSAPSGW